MQLSVQLFNTTTSLFPIQEAADFKSVKSWKMMMTNSELTKQTEEIL